MSVFDFTLSEAMCYVTIGVVLILNSEVKAPPFAVSVTLLLFWLFLLGYSLGWIFKRGRVRSRHTFKRRTGSRKQKARRFRRRSLPFFLVLRCRNRPMGYNSPPETEVIYGYTVITRRYTPQDRQHSRWRRRQRKSKSRARERRALDHVKFLTPNRSGRDLWNDTRAVNSDFLGARGADTFLPHADGIVPEDVLDKFVAERADTFLPASRLKSKL